MDRYGIREAKTANGRRCFVTRRPVPADVLKKIRASK